MENLLETLQSCKDEQVEEIITKALNQIISNSNKVNMLGFSENMQEVPIHIGFIHPETKIKYNNLSMNYYSMKTTDYFYDFAHYIRKHGIKSKGQLTKIIENYMNDYFGIKTQPGDFRDDYFDKLAFRTTTTDDEYFEKLEMLEIGDLKGKNIAMCTERAAMAQNLLSLFGIDTYYCMGSITNNSKSEMHSFNIVKAKELFILLDYSIPCPVFSNGKIVDYAPFQGKIELTEIEDLLNNNMSKVFSDYDYVVTKNGIKKIETRKLRKYSVGNLKLKQNSPHHL